MGIIQEQHPERTRLFRQWKQMDKMTLFNDSLNRLGVSAVPIVLFVDAHGIIRERNPDVSDLSPFLTTSFTDDRAENSVELRTLPGDDPAIAGQWTKAIAEYESFIERHPNDADALFRLGVCYRARFDAKQQPSDFQLAVRLWNEALALRPNQYIWRRRIQQFGPRLSKPYPFYNWVDTAKKEIAARGETPIPLTIRLSAAETMDPEDLPLGASKNNADPDPQNRITQDRQKVVNVESVIVPSTEASRNTFHVHLLLSIDKQSGYEWNDEAGPMTIWIEQGKQRLDIPPPNPSSNSGDVRAVEFEVEAKNANQILASGYVLYHVCNKRTGVCYYWRQDFSLPNPSSVEDRDSITTEE